MSSTNKTPNYQLPQFINSDVPSWLGDFNDAMSKIDTQMKSNDTKATSASTNAENANSSATQALETANQANTNASNAITKADQANANVQTAIDTANTASSNATTANQTANNANTNANQAIQTVNTLNSKLKYFNKFAVGFASNDQILSLNQGDNLSTNFFNVDNIITNDNNIFKLVDNQIQLNFDDSNTHHIRITWYISASANNSNTDAWFKPARNKTPFNNDTLNNIFTNSNNRIGNNINNLIANSQRYFAVQNNDKITLALDTFVYSGTSQVTIQNLRTDQNKNLNRSELIIEIVD